MNCLSLETFERDLRRMTDMDYKELLEQIKDFLSSCEKMRYGEYVGAQWPYDHAGEMVYTEPEDILLDLAATAITDLLARSEAAEAAQDTLQRAMAEYKARAEKAERERDAAVNDLKKEVMGKIWACDYCKKNDPDDFQCTHDDLCGCHEWEWRGQKEE